MPFMSFAPVRCPTPKKKNGIKNRNLPIEIQQKVNRLLKKSVEYAFANPKSSIEFIKQHAQEMDEAVMYKHIALYVNQYSINLGEEGKKAIDTLDLKSCNTIKTDNLKNKCLDVINFKLAISNKNNSLC